MDRRWYWVLGVGIALMGHPAVHAQSLPPIDLSGPRNRPVDDIITQLRVHPSVPDLLDAAAAGPAMGPEGGELVANLLNQHDADLRDMAATALGYIRYAPARLRLQQALSDANDVRVSARAAMALGRLGDPAALPALRDVVARYWYPPVRTLAAAAIAQIEKPAPLEPFKREDWIFADPLPYPVTCGATKVRPMLGNELAVAGGRLIGVDKGEFGGGLFFDDGQGHRKEIGDMNVQAVTTFGNHIVAVTGLAHMGWVRGDLYRVERQGDGTWRAVHWRRLPYAPYGATRDGDHLRIVLPEADIQIDATGAFSMPACPNTRHGTWNRDRVALTS